ncbi:coil containing protein [Vibrio phage 1.097.O._10N.286.49.B3]|uniref:Coil containing protein n=1 Tax=Vibrio phage 1.097.O._10N.286.49.B3 TaxID=1881383 RepID=A0A2I7R0R6_9CAUD|nr:coil containing protein [Vibrio phage 1.097.O._10N.286.49.B3]AUR87241.1 coil containing protein [Vibrio phage 1.097.O._10N.286.49.B3]
MLMNIWLLIKLPYNIIRLICHYIECGAQSVDTLADAEVKRKQARAEREESLRD